MLRFYYAAIIAISMPFSYYYADFHDATLITTAATTASLIVAVQ